MSIEYGGGLYETIGAAQDAAIDDYLTAEGRQKVSDGIDPEDSCEDVARDMVAIGWQVPGLEIVPGMDDIEDAIDDLTDRVRERLQAHGIRD